MFSINVDFPQVVLIMECNQSLTESQIQESVSFAFISFQEFKMKNTRKFYMPNNFNDMMASWATRLFFALKKIVNKDEQKWSQVDFSSKTLVQS